MDSKLGLIPNKFKNEGKKLKGGGKSILEKSPVSEDNTGTKADTPIPSETPAMIIKNSTSL